MPLSRPRCTAEFRERDTQRFGCVHRSGYAFDGRAIVAGRAGTQSSPDVCMAKHAWLLHRLIPNSMSPLPLGAAQPRHKLFAAGAARPHV